MADRSTNGADARSPRFRQPEVEVLGAQPFTCDFHLHAPPSDWQDDTGTRSVEDYVANVYLPQAYVSGRQVIGVTQHGAICESGAKEVRDIAQRLRSNGNPAIPVVFPGYELTSSDQIQLILLTDPDKEDLRGLDGRVQEALRLQRRHWHESELSLIDMLKTVRERFHDDLVAVIVGTGTKGILQDRDAARRNRNIYTEAMELSDGLMLSKSFGVLDDFTKSILQGEQLDYGGVPAARLQSSDARTLRAMAPDNLSHVKLGSFSIEALRQALLNRETFLSEAFFSAPNWAITRLLIRKTVFLDGIDIRFNPRMTTFVGGRGSGKSCLLEYIAHACDYQRPTGNYDRPNWKILQSTPEGTLLPDSEIELHVRLGEKHYRIGRKCQDPPQVFECEDGECNGGVLQPASSATALLNLRFFGQRELANIVRNESFFTLDPSERGGTNLFSFLKSDQLTQVDVEERKAYALSDEIQKLSIDMASWVRELAERPKLVSERERLNQDLEKIRRQANHPALRAHPEFLQIRQSMEGLFVELEGIRGDLDSLIRTVEARKRKLDTALSPTTTGAEGSLETMRLAALAQIDQLMTTLRSSGATWRSDIDGLRSSAEAKLIGEKLQAHQQEYDKAKAETEAQKINLKLLEPLQTRIQDVDRRLAAFIELDGKLTEGRVRRRNLVLDLRACRASQSDTYVKLAETLTASTRERVRMEVIRAGDVQRAVTALQDQIGDKRRFKITDALELAKAILATTLQRGEGTHPATLWTELVDHLLGHFEVKQDEALGRSRTDGLCVGCPWVGPLLDRVQELVAHFEDQQVGQLLCQHVPDSMKMELRRKVDAPDYISISDASLGQKATALFLILLAQTEGLLVIDQPEDDLDNAFIANDILPAIHELKDRQQIIFATHNANMLVNGESEKIVVLDTEPTSTRAEGQSSIRGKIQHEGGIDQKDLREAVSGILEGGREAFLARERKYRFRQV